VSQTSGSVEPEPQAPGNDRRTVSILGFFICLSSALRLNVLVDTGSAGRLSGKPAEAIMRFALGRRGAGHWADIGITAEHLLVVRPFIVSLGFFANNACYKVSARVLFKPEERQPGLPL